MLAVVLALGTARSATAAEPAAQSRTAHATAPNQFVEAGGARFAYRRLGPATGTPLLFLQHFTGTMDGWDPLVTDGLAQGRPVILFNNRGVGLSGGETPDTVEAMAQDTIAFLDALGIARVDLLGFSLGGFVAQELGLRHPDRVRRVVLAGTGPRGGQDMQESRPDVIAALQSGNPDQARAYLFFSQSPPSQAAAGRFLDRTRQRSTDPDTQASPEATQAQGKAIHAWGQVASNADWIARLREFKPATLVVNGNDDIMIPTINTYALSQAIPKAQLIVYPDAGHGALFQYPELFVQHVGLFLDRDDEGLNETR
ncbi:Hydrolase, alpha/beta fold family functionally coupled to Phosphoribulokinase [plant metagenome]|uniref:Hydrolase, alpha/beta fold family functionally coupled to Phosphoribulokinase n=1 Tax=plant metagenome TaxID=1297885 RepID=A0A484Q255_9ZZZZ